MYVSVKPDSIEYLVRFHLFGTSAVAQDTIDTSIETNDTILVSVLLGSLH